MRTQKLIITLLLVSFAVALFGCRRGEEDATPPPMPTAATTVSLPDEASTPANTPAPRSTPTAVPQTAVSASAIDWPPQLVYSSPAPGEEVLLDGAITLRFDQPMDKASVESAFAATDAGGSAVAGAFTWTRDDTLIFTPRTLRRQAEYRVRVGDAATAANGRSLAVPVDLALRTVGFLTVSQVIPAADTGSVDTDSSITVLFNRPVVPIVSTAQQAGLPQPLTLSPAVAGQGEWVSSSIYRFLPDEPLAGATTYTVAVAGGLADVTGGVLEETLSWTFTTRSPEIVTIEPPNGAEGVVPTRPITITFNMPMDRASTEAAVLLPGVGIANTAVDFGWRDGDRVLVLTPRQPLLLDTDYQVTVGASAAAASGQATLGQNEVSAFRTVPFPAVAYTRPAANGVADRFESGVTIGFASPMDFDTLEDQIQIEPEPLRVNSFWSDFNNEYILNFSLARNSTYRVTIPGSAADPYGNTLGRDFVWQFDTPDYDPIASFNLPAQISQLSTSFVTSVDIVHRNVSRLNVSLTELGLPLGLLLNPFDLYEYRPAAAPRATWALPLTNQDGVTSLPLADSGTLPTGIYYLSVTAPELQQETRFWQNQRHLLVVADTNIVIKEMFDEVHVWVTNIATGQPAAGRSLTLYNVRGVQSATAVSDASGFARFSREPVDYLEGVLVVSGTPGAAGFGVASSSWNLGVSPWQFNLQVGYNPQPSRFAYLYTDRPIYRPGDTVYFKGILRQPEYGRYAQPGGGSVRLSLNPAFYFEEQALSETFTYDLSPDGSFNGSYTLPEEVSLGTYQLSLDGQDFGAARQFTVAEYRRPEFLVSLTPARAEALRGESVPVTLEANYFFGGPAADLPVNWAVYADTFSPALPNAGRFSFGDGAGFFADPFNPFFGGGEQGVFVLGGEARTNADGRFTLTLPADLLRDIAAGSRRVTVEANVLDLSNVPISSRTSVTFHAAEAYVGVTPADYAAAAGTETVVDLLTTDWDGRPLGGQAVEVIFYRREWERRRSADFGGYQTFWEPVDTEIARAQVQTNAQGQANASFTPDLGGTYVAVATVRDDSGRQQTSSAYLWVVDPAFAGWRSDPRERRMGLVPDKAAYAPGDVAQILVQSPFDGPIRAWLTIERGRLIEQQLITLQSGSDVLAIPLPASYAPNVHVSVTAVKPVTPADPDNPYADIRIGIVELPVSIEQLVLDVQLTPRGDGFAPRDTATYDIRVTDFAGRPVQAELSLALVDLAILTLKSDNAPPIQEAFYAPQPIRSQMGSGLIISGEGLEVELPTEGGGFGGGGGGDVAEEALARAPGGEDESVRRDFPDTAFWEAVIITDAGGQAAVDIPLPDTLTTWRLSAKAVTPDTLVGQSSVDVVVSLPLLIRPVTPRFFTVGDVVQLGAIVNNTTDSVVEATVSLEATGLSGRLADQTVRVPANGQQIVRWEVTVEDGTAVDLTFRVQGGGFQDATKPGFGVGPDNLIPVYRYSAEDVVGSSGVLTDRDRRVEAVLLPPNANLRRGAIDVTLSPSLAAALLTSLEAQEQLPYDAACAHAVADRLLPNVVTAAAIRELGLAQPALLAELDAIIPQQIDDVVRLQLPGGGWGWCGSGQRNDFLTAYVLFALVQADFAGYAVPVDVLADGGALLSNSLVDPADMRAQYAIDRQIFILYVMHLLGEEVPVLYDRHVSEHRDLLSPYAKALLAEIYDNTGFTPENRAALLADLNDAAILSATGTHWEDDAPDYWQNLSSDVRTTAIVVHALAQLEPDSGLLPGAVRWLMVARQADRWPTTHETAWSILALTRWMAATGELQADYSYALAINLQPEIQGQFTSETLLDSEATSIPAAELAPDAVNYVEVSRGEGNGRLYYTVHLDSFFDAADAPAVSRGVTVQRAYYDAACDPETDDCAPITRISAGQQVRVELTIIAPSNQVYLVVRDPLPSGAEAIDPGLATSPGGAGPDITPVGQDYRRGYWGWWFFNRTEFRDEQVVFYAEFLPAGTYQYTYMLQATIPGAYQVMPATARQAFFPEVFGRSAGLLFTID